MGSRSFCILIALVASFLAFGPAARAQALGLASTQSLSFGKFSTGTGGTLTIEPSGARTRSGGVVLLSSGPGSAGKFTVTGDPDLVYSISLPADGTVTLSSGGHTMSVHHFASLPAGTGILTNGIQTLSVGATLTVDLNQAPADYNGTFSITVDYQ